MTTTILGAQGLMVTAMMRRERTESTWECILNVLPPAREKSILHAMRRVCDMVVLPDVS
jgi:hypothetical protein